MSKICFRSQGCRWRSNLGLKLANAFGVSQTKSLFHLETPRWRPITRGSGGGIGAHPPPHPNRGKRISRELRDGRGLIDDLGRCERLFVVYLNRVARRAAHVGPVEGDARAGAEARVRRRADERGRGERCRGGRWRNGQRR
jgi:hypothetical protein